MQVILLRHGEAGRHAVDSLRELTDSGEAMARAAAQHLLASTLLPAVLYTSPLVRARQTAAIVAEVLGLPSILPTEYLTPYADHRQMFTLLAGRSEERFLLVGHEPYLSTMISLLVTGSRAGHYPMGVGTLACIDCAPPVGPSSGRLQWMRPTSIAPGV